MAVFGEKGEASSRVDVVVLAAKPQIMQATAVSLRNAVLGKGCLIISVAAGIRLSALAAWLGDAAAIVRVMPNTPAIIQTGASALYANSCVTPAQKETAEAIMRSGGTAIWLAHRITM